MEDSESKNLAISQILGNNRREVSPWLAVTFSLLIYPGSGQLMNRKIEKAVVFGLFFTVLAGLFVYFFANGVLIYLDLIPGSVKSIGPSSWLNICGIGREFSLSVYWGVLTFIVYVWAAIDSFCDANVKKDVK